MSICKGIRIVATGAGGVGKTTTIKFLSGSLDLPFLKSASRTIYEEKNLTEDKVWQMCPRDRLKLQKEIFEAKIKLDQQYSYVADRTILDHYIYCLLYCHNVITDNYFEEIEEKVRTLMLSMYDQILYFPWGYWFAKSDGVRQDRKSWQSMIDALLVGYILRWNLPIITVPQDYGEDYRNEFILKTIKGEK